MRRLLILAVSLCGWTAFGWESICTRYADRSLEPEALKLATGELCQPSSGPSTARQRWIGPIDEHRQLWELVRAKAGLPAEVSATQRLDVYTSATPIRIGADDGFSLVPVPFAEAARVQSRYFTPGELAHLPDFSYALWDWASGHEQCPLPGASTAADCHDFAAHMGPVNSNHFMPQARTFYARSHALALARARECASLKTALGSFAPRFETYLKACEIEALSIEAVGHHYLQDAWSMGHMWQRWGSSDLAEFPGADAEEQRDRAVLTALVSGLFHGARSVLQALPEWTTYDVNDAMCAPWPDVRFRTSAGAIAQGVGDNYSAMLPPLASSTTFELQSKTFFECAVSGVLAVYQAAGQNHGVATAGEPWLSRDPTGDECFGQRATNSALARGAAVDLKIVGLQTSLPIDARLVGWMLPKVARAQGKVPVTPRVRNEFRFDLQRIVSLARLRAKEAPDETDLADGRWGSFLGVKPNGQYVSNPPYLDPALPWPSTPDSSAEARARAQILARTFHRAHAADLCATFSAGSLTELRAHAKDAALDADGRAAACAACAEFTVRHLRIGTSSSWDTALEPLCRVLSPEAPVVYHSTTPAQEPIAVAADWCCGG
jgi:hypothetical protein